MGLGNCIPLIDKGFFGKEKEALMTDNAPTADRLECRLCRGVARDLEELQEVRDGCPMFDENAYEYVTDDCLAQVVDEVVAARLATEAAPAAKMSS
jgi:hypothetical protein